MTPAGGGFNIFFMFTPKIGEMIQSHEHISSAFAFLQHYPIDLQNYVLIITLQFQDQTENGREDNSAKRFPILPMGKGWSTWTSMDYFFQSVDLPSPQNKNSISYEGFESSSIWVLVVMLVEGSV